MNRPQPARGRTGEDVSQNVRSISILSGKGGVGKSVVAFNLAERTAASGLRTLLVDADICCGNLQVMANVSPSGGLDAFANGEVDLAEAVTGCRQNLDLLARSETGPLGSLQEVADVARFAAHLRERAADYNLVIVDQSSGISNTATLLASTCDANLVVLVPELTSISDGFGICKYLYQAYAEVDCRILINRVEDDQEAEFIWTRFAALAKQFLGRVPALAGSLPEDPAVRLAVASQRALVEVSPGSDVVQALTEIAQSLVQGSPPTQGQISTHAINSNQATAEIRE